MRMWETAKPHLLTVALALQVLPEGMPCDDCKDPAANLSVRCMGCLHPGPCYLCQDCHVRRHGPSGSLRRHPIHVWTGLCLEPLTVRFPRDAAEPDPPSDAEPLGECSAWHARAMPDRAAPTQ